MRKTLLSVMLLTAGLFAGCATPSTAMVECPPAGCATLDPPPPLDQQLLAHASFDLQCAPSALAIDNLDSTTSQVSGCGRAARYAWTDESRWVLDSPVVDGSTRFKN